MNSEICEIDDYSSSSDEAEALPIAAPVKRKNVCPLVCLHKKIKYEDPAMDGWFNYMRSYVPLMKLMLEDYKMKWESYQYRQYAKINDPYYEETDEESDTSNGTVTSGVADGFPNSEKDDIVLTIGRENIRAGYYMFLSYFQGGWLYPEVKRYFRQKHGVRCFRSEVTNNALKEPDDYRALIKFRTIKARADVFAKLSEKNMLTNFTFVCVDASEEYFNDSVIAKLRNTKGCIGLPSFFVCMRR